MFKKRCQFVDGGEWYCLAWALCWCREGIALLVGGGACCGQRGAGGWKIGCNKLRGCVSDE